MDYIPYVFGFGTTGKWNIAGEGDSMISAVAISDAAGVHTRSLRAISRLNPAA